MQSVEISLLGTPIIRVDGEIVTVERRKSLAIIAFIAATGQLHRRDELSGIFWSDIDQSRALANLRQALVDMKRVLPDDALESNRSILGMNADAPIAVDTRRFDRLLDAYKKSNDIEHLADAIKLYRGEFMTGFSLTDAPEFDDWQRIETERYRREAADALNQLARHFQDIGEIDIALNYATQLLEINRLDETVHRLLIRLYAENKKISEAMNQYMDCVRLLRDELGMDPQPATQKLYEDLLNLQIRPSETDPLMKIKVQNAGLAVDLPQTLYPPHPKGVIGRKDDLQRLKQQIGITGDDPTPMTIVTGTLGVGKSMLLASLAHDNDIESRYPDGVLWVRLGNKPDLKQELMDWATVFGIDTQHIGEAELAMRIRSMVQSRKMLLLIDDAWSASDAMTFNVGGDACAMVISTRFSSVARQLAGSPHAIVPLAPLADDDALQLLNWITPAAVERYPDELTVLIRRYDGLPLALQIIGRMIEIEMALGWGALDMLDNLLDSDAILEGRVPAEIEQEMQIARATLREYIQRIFEDVDVDVLDIAIQIAQHHPENEPFDVAQAGDIWQADNPRHILRALVEAGIVEIVGEGQFKLPILFQHYLLTIAPD